MLIANGVVKLFADGKAAEQKAIWVVKGNDCVIDGVEFLECKVADKNGAGIRVEGTNITITHCTFRRNEMGVLAGNNNQSRIIVQYSEFDRSGYGDGYSHNIYINHIKSFIFRFNYSHRAYIGHELKSRAAFNPANPPPTTNTDFMAKLTNRRLKDTIVRRAFNAAISISETLWWPPGRQINDIGVNFPKSR